ncbi:MATE family efflux transporter [Aliikangiella marina]|uniref:Multidrug-efflux transporter n=1 Tax=Aliikangiella marina TaxID=1712262 RepID=A0A545TD51_9GAMM|nr:MATE family efflux transporter [Aliikangiella marina]TQV75148.1 MATE family efflux transporter [Aliikangiella marina]
MVSRDRSSQIFQIALPIIGGMMSQNILNIVDAAMVGQLGSTPLAAVGLASFMNFVAAAVFMGMASGVQAMVARRVGEGRESEAANPLNGALLTIFVAAIPLTIILTWLSEPIMAMLNDDPEVVKHGVQYLDARLIGIMAVGMNFSFRGYLSAIKMTSYYFKTLLIMHSLNILLNYLLIFGNWGFPELGTEGAGLGTSLSMFGGTLMYFYLTMRYTSKYGFGLHLPHKETFYSVIRISLPSSAQQLFFALGFTILFWIVGQIGTAELAAANVLTTLTLVAILPSIAFGMSSATLVGQALGRKDVDDAHQWAWDTSKIAIVGVSLISIPMFFVPELLLSIFLHEQEVIDVAKVPLQLVGIAIIIDAVNLVLMSSLQGAGDTKTTMIVGIVCQWLIFLPIAWVIGPYMGMGLTAIWLTQGLYRLGQTFWFARLWQQRRWAEIKMH